MRQDSGGTREDADPVTPSRLADPVVAASEFAVDRRSQVLAIISRYAVLVALIAMVAVFGSMRPSVFLTTDNLRSILTLSAPTLVIALGLTVVLTMQDFDLSVGGMVGLGGATAVVLMSDGHQPWGVALIGGLGMGVGFGLVNGAIVASTSASSFIVTLGTSSAMTGVEFFITGQKTIFTGISPGYVKIGQGTFLTLNLQIWIALALTIVTYVFLHRSEIGRYMYAIGDSPSAALISGVRIRRLRIAGFAITALAAAIAGIMITAQGAASTPQAGTSYLLPSYAAAFLGSAVFSLGRFNVPGTVVGVLLLSVLETGLAVLGLSTAVVNVAQGAVLVAAITLSRLDLSQK